METSLFDPTVRIAERSDGFREGADDIGSDHAFRQADSVGRDPACS
jgi:hypothetical protein